MGAEKVMNKSWFC